MSYWRTANYGPLRRKEVVKHVKSLPNSVRNSLLKQFWEKVDSGIIGYQVRKDVFGTKVARFFFQTPVQIVGTSYDIQEDHIRIVSFEKREDLMEQTSLISTQFREGYDFVKLREVLEKKGPEFTPTLQTLCYLDPTSHDEIKQKPTPMHNFEVKVDPKLEQVPSIIQEAQDILHEHEKEYFSRCMNTFELHDMQTDDPEIVALQEEKHRMLIDCYNVDHYECTEDALERLTAYSLLLVTDIDQEGNCPDRHVNFTVSELCMMGCHNSAKGGASVLIREEGMTKASTNHIATLEALKILKDCAELGNAVIRPHTMNPKDELNKPEKKEKMFNMLDHSNQKLHYLFYGDFTDRNRCKLQNGFLMGVSANGCCLDEMLRIQLGISSGTGRCTDEELLDMKIIQSDFAGFEYHPDHNCHLILAWARAMRLGGGVKNKQGEPDDMLRAALALEFERKVLPDLRVGGVNNVFKTPGIQISGEPDTLTWNQLMHLLMVLTAQWMYNEKNNRFSPDDTPLFEAAPKNGDDGITPRTEYTEAVFKELSTHTPVKFEVEKKGSLLSAIEDGQLINDGISFCKVNFVLKDGIIRQQREYRNLHKVVKGNKSTWDPRSVMAACINQTQNVWGNQRYYNLLKRKFELYEKAFGKLSELGRKPTEDCRDATAMDTVLVMDRFPDEEEVNDILYTKDEVAILQLYNNLARHYVYNIPAVGVAKF